MCNVPQIIAEAAADRKCQKLCPIEAEASAARTAFGSIDNDGVRSSPSERCFRTSDISQLDRRRWHDQPPSSLCRLATTQPCIGASGDANVGYGTVPGAMKLSDQVVSQRDADIPLVGLYESCRQYTTDIVYSLSKCPLPKPRQPA